MDALSIDLLPQHEFTDTVSVETYRRSRRPRCRAAREVSAREMPLSLVMLHGCGPFR